MKPTRRLLSGLPEGTAGAVTSGSPSGHGAAWQIIHAAWRARDEARGAELWRLEREGRICRFCGRRLNEAVMARHPGLCQGKPCVRLAEKLEAALRQMRGKREAEE